MNNMRILICATFTLLVAILVYIYINTANTNKLTDTKTLEQLQYERDQAYIDVDLNDPIPEYTAPAPALAPAPTPPTDFEKQLTEEEEKKIAEEEIKRQADALEQEVLAAEKAKIDDQLQANQAPPISDARLQLISQALVMATVNHFDEPSRITLLDIVRPENIVKGQILGIRRQKSGIIGRVRIDRIQGGQAFADPIPESFFGKPVEINVGDELIVIP